MKKIFAIGIFLFSTVIVFATDSHESFQAYAGDSAYSAFDLEGIVVTATRTPKALKDVPLVTRVISAEDIRKADAANIEDLLKAVLPGVEFSYTMSQQTNLNLTGFGGNAVMFLIDGERLAGETLDNIDYQRLTLDNVERIEIVKGAASALYGSSAVGGVVNIITKTPKEPITANLYGRWGDHSNQRYGGVIGVKAKNVTSSTTATYQSSDEITFKNDGDYSKIYGFHTYNLSEKLTWDPFNKLNLTAKAGYYFRERDYSNETHDRYRDLNMLAKAVYTFGQHDNLEAVYSFDEYDKSDYTMQQKKDVRDYANVQHTVRALYNHTFSDNGTITLGGDFMRDYLMSYQFENNGAKYQYVADGFLQLDYNPTERLNLIMALRYDHFSDADASHFSPKMGLMYRLPNWRLRASYSGGFRAPTLKEMYMAFDMASIFMIYGNKDLKPEVSDNLQVSAEYTKRNVSLTLSGFYNFFENRITTTWNSSLNGMEYVNMSKVEIRGIDFNTQVRFNFGVMASLSYVFTDEHIPAGQPLTISTRPHSAVLRVEYDHTFNVHGWLKSFGFNAAINGRWLSKLTADEYTSYTDMTLTERVTYPGYQIWKFTLMARLPRTGLNVTFTIDNLFNYTPDYYYGNSPYTTGTVASLGVSWDIDRLWSK